MKPKIFITFAPLKHSADFLLWRELFISISGSIINIPYKSLYQTKVNLPKLLPDNNCNRVNLSVLSIKVNFKPFTYILYV